MHNYISKGDRHLAGKNYISLCKHLNYINTTIIQVDGGNGSVTTKNVNFRSGSASHKLTRAAQLVSHKLTSRSL